ncbi:MAG TPA: cell division ATP-binding protein FtsE [Syntrophothermus lipocalidus]|uniref:Cell division ATP-binding protein FtsE n=1 Tax=Syntrophothermus lipocalidus (strain DSM 12680 / TGB-C1) TaxID=643648 RepID=D7CPJ1_SYNLT|nr:cell division ATP-binding protein FtsE [Syntrophothermus lipocalidus]ADI02626.1 Sigma 54 interacting domain protein [Syntrophothermus lipocalidus DSM 12680]HHV76149.1 cell division ATP-binding protein FtsE [Syntrophothermus lipocalidus]HOV43162.1 cell division ATP-binding protein FtsE [Syntrophothermus lipocalidus]
MLVQLYNVSKTYPNGVKALNDVSLKIDRGEFVFLMGQSGAGKSTLLKLLYREELPTRGQIFIASRSVVRMKAGEIPMLRRNIGVVFQDYKLLENKTVFENVAFAMQVVGGNRHDISRRVEETLRLVGLRDKAGCYPSQLSGGEQQRAGIARAIVNRPLIVIADEPTGNLDADTSWEIMDLLQEVNKNGTTVIMATHAQEIVRRMQKRVVFLKEGSVVHDSLPEEFIA